MLNSKNVVTLGCDFRQPKGGVAQVLNTYAKFMSPFHFICTTKGRGVIINFLQLLYSVSEFIFLCLFNKSIKIVHIHGASYYSFFRKRIFISIGHVLGKKIVYHIHGAEFDKFSKRHKKEVSSTLRKIDCVIALSQYWKSFFEREFDFHNVRILPNVIPSREYCNKSIEKPFHALFLGYLGERKGIYDLLQTIAEHKDELRGNFIMHVGGNGEIDNVKKFIQAKGIQDIVRFEGWVNGEEKVRLLSKCHFYILPSYAEGLPISILEAMSYQMPILSTPVGGIPEIVENGVNGFLSVPGNHEALYKNIRTLIDNPSQVKEMGRQSYLRVKKHFAENVQKELDTIYQELLK